ncbi:hypothetical protein [Ancylobacter pratisalsi]|uniref:Uncharacterized protein n=1 Tax=Ancylobacter pratisalsi TaxID=1745854 RepID=A0A6P1YM18_9HYPH|nr:hypothetical protein [Ancylobacter pratisalsi]QIB33726.1 hypothetical protein G3A50_08430 [Ancylobacter pratisalsi]
MIAEQVRSVIVRPSWTPVDLVPDGSRPFVALQSSRPFRLRMNGQVYLVAGDRPLGLDFRRARQLDLKSLSGDIDVTVTRYAAIP